MIQIPGVHIQYVTHNRTSQQQNVLTHTVQQLLFLLILLLFIITWVTEKPKTEIRRFINDIQNIYLLYVIQYWWLQHGVMVLIPLN